MNKFVRNITEASTEKTYLFSVGQAGYIIKSKHRQLLGVDLYLSECVERVEGHIGFKRLLPRLLEPFDLEFDCLVTTHPHFDHFDIDSIPQMMSNNRTKLFASLGCRKEIERLLMMDRNVAYVKPGDICKAGDFLLEFVSCDHGNSAPDAVGLIITVDGKRIYETGDTCLRLDRKEEYMKKGPFDILIAPINGAFGNMNEEDCAELSHVLNPKVTIPCHYGMFASHGGDPGRFLCIMNENCPSNKVILMAQGERLALD